MSSIGNSDDDIPQLSAHALAALQEFYAESSNIGGANVSEAVTVQENWQLSQFWYDDLTAQVLAEEALRASECKRVACVSCPTLFQKLISIKPSHTEVKLLEYDRRFEKYDTDFVFYDYNEPLALPDELQQGMFDLVVADPPFLSEGCLAKTAETVKFLSKDKVLLCTGAVMEDLACKLMGLKPCAFVPRHARNLGNEFRCYTNYETGLNEH